MQGRSHKHTQGDLCWGTEAKPRHPNPRSQAQLAAPRAGGHVYPEPTGLVQHLKSAVWEHILLSLG